MMFVLIALGVLTAVLFVALLLRSIGKALAAADEVLRE
jgi:hypothetical protein